MPKALPEGFRRDVIAIVRKGEAPLRQIAKDFGISEGCLHRWLKIADRDDGASTTMPGSDESVELREARKRIKLLKHEAEVMRRAVANLSRDVNPKLSPPGSRPCRRWSTRHSDLPGSGILHTRTLQMKETASKAT